MTNQAKFDELYKAFADKSDAYIKAEKTLSETRGFGDLEELSEHITSHGEWQTASNNYHSFLASFKGRNFDPNAEYGGLN